MAWLLSHAHDWQNSTMSACHVLVSATIHKMTQQLLVFRAYTHRQDTSQSDNNTHTGVMALFRDQPGKPVPERQNQSGFYWTKWQWVAVSSAGLYASLHLAPDR